MQKRSGGLVQPLMALFRNVWRFLNAMREHIMVFKDLIKALLKCLIQAPKGLTEAHKGLIKTLEDWFLFLRELADHEP